MTKPTIKSLQTDLADAKQEVLDFKKELQKVKGELNKFKGAGEKPVGFDDLQNTALGFVRVDKTYYEIVVRFDKDCEQAAIESKKSLGTSFPTAQGRIRKTFAYDVLDPARKSK